MEFTDFRELKKLMAENSVNEFEFETSNEAENKYGGKGGGTYETYKNSAIQQSHNKRDRNMSDDTDPKSKGSSGIDSSSGSSSSSSEDGSDVDEYNYMPGVKIDAIEEDDDEDLDDEDDKDDQLRQKTGKKSTLKESEIQESQADLVSNTEDMMSQMNREDEEETKQVRQGTVKQVNDQVNGQANRKSSYQIQFENKQGQEKFKKEVMDEYKKDKVLTFRDMSHLSYFGMKKNQNTDQLSYVTDFNSDNKVQVQSHNHTPKDIAQEIIEDLLDIVFGDNQNDDTAGKGFINDQVIMNNFASLRKKVFIKEKVDIKPKTFKNNRLNQTDQSKNNTLTTNSAFEESLQEKSLLTTIIDNNNENSHDFLLPTPSTGDSKAISIKIYLFTTPKFIQIYIYRKSQVQDVIRHIMTMYSKDQILSKDNPLKYHGVPDAYELRIIDDDEDYFVPFYDIGPLERKDEIGEFESLAFLENKTYINQAKQNKTQPDEYSLQVEEQLKKENKRLLAIQINTAILKSNMSIVMNQDETLRDLTDQISKRAGENFLNQKLFVIIPCQLQSQNKNQYLATISQYGGQTTAYQENIFNIAQQSGRFDYDANHLNQNTIIRNLKTTNLMLTDRIYVDKPINKQKEVPMQKKKDMESTFKENNVLQLLKNTSTNTSQNTTNQYENMSLIQPSSSNEKEKQEHRQEDDFLFGSISAAKHQEFVVTKINRRGKRQTRVLGIDGFNIYNIRKSQAKAGLGGQSVDVTMPTEKEKKRGSFFSGFLGKKLLGVKRKARAINTIDEIIKINNQTISIVFLEKSGTKKAIVYECLSADNCSEIIAKLNFLRHANSNISASVQQPSTMLAQSKFAF
ncbi:UNKNOWN [Stylonychia lemnae]|uniref:Uncharacterized protein n=1 Tax=Stylonychia lemnae TaxID=5949 RepID=A0A077ZQB3_STYLE|nr:UNKNOWN [Stylonychia lemnae]|eukprot:CDW71590.1 UNKNOWN [Stylonychia lemnae]